MAYLEDLIQRGGCALGRALSAVQLVALQLNVDTDAKGQHLH
jgi:hypothetical protein